jgi:peroxiredoxin
VDFHRHRRWEPPPVAQSGVRGALEDGARRAAFERFHTPERWPWWMLDTVKDREHAAPPTVADALATITLPDHDGRPGRIGDLWRDGPAVVVWLRQFGCPFCRAYSVELNRARRAFEQAGARLALIGQGTPAQAAAFRRHLRIELPILADGARITYLAAGTKLATLDELIGPAVVAKGLVAMARQRVIIGHNTADEAQLGGAMVIAPGGRVGWAHMSEDASDMAPPAVIVAAIDALSRPIPFGTARRTAALRAERSLR